MRRLVLFLTFALAIGLAPPASASTVTLVNGTLTFVGNPGADNDVTISGTSAARIVVADADQISPPPIGCNEIAPGTDYSCAGVSRIVLDLNTGDDSVSIGTPPGLTWPTSITGGAGDDTIASGAAADVIDGGPGDDVLSGNAGVDDLAGGDGIDTIDGGADADTVDGGAGNDGVGGGNGNDTVNGGIGNDTVTGDAGNDTVDGGVGDDGVGGGAGDDRVNGGDGDDSLSDDGGSDVLSGGTGFDSLDFSQRASVSATIDGVANDGAPGETANVLTDVEDVYATANTTGTVRLVGSDTANQLTVGTGTATIDGLAGPDSILGSDGNDTISARDGFPDRIRCYGGTDTVIADSLDTVSTTCENVQTEVVPGPAGLDDRPPTVAWSTPASAASFRGEVAQALAVTATDDRGVAKVQFFDEDRLLCEDTAAPYECNYRARGADVGRNTLVAVAIDTAGQAGTAIRLVNVGKFRPTVPLRLSPSRDRRAPYKFTASGTLTNAGTCSGTVTVTAKAGKRTVSTRRAKVSSSCRYSVAVSFKSRVRSSLKFTARYGGNTSTAARSSTSRTARLG